MVKVKFTRVSVHLICRCSTVLTPSRLSEAFHSYFALDEKMLEVTYNNSDESHKRECETHVHLGLKVF